MWINKRPTLCKWSTMEAVRAIFLRRHHFFLILSFVPGMFLHLMPTEFTVEAIPYFIALSTWKRDFRTWPDVNNKVNWKCFSKICYFQAENYLWKYFSFNRDFIYRTSKRSVANVSVLEFGLLSTFTWGFGVSQAKLLYYVYTSSVFIQKLLFSKTKHWHFLSFGYFMSHYGMHL